jgi:hypothetical protein
VRIGHRREASVDAAKMTRDQLKKVVAAARKQKFDPKPYSNIKKGMKAFEDGAKKLAALAKQLPDV